MSIGTTWCQWHLVMLTLTPLASHDPDTDMNDVTWSKKFIGPHFNCLDLRDVIVALMIMWVSHGTVASVNGSTWTKTSCCNSFQSSYHNECNGGMSLVACYTDTSANASMWLKMLCCRCSHLGLMNSVVLLTMTLASCAGGASASSVNWLKNSCCI